MAIDINGLTSSQTSVNKRENQVTPINTDKSENQAETGKSSTSDTISLTDSAKQAQQLEKQIEAQPVVDTQKVIDARQAIDNGTYVVSAKNIAQKLMQFEALLS